MDDPATAGELARLDGSPVTADDRGGAALRPEHPMWVIYTSGSTGRPKGVLVEHRAIVNFLASMQDLFSLTPADRLLAVSTVGCDMAGLEFYLPFVTGAHMVLASQDQVLDPWALRGLIRSTGATVVHATPSLWRGLVADAGDALDWTGVRVLIGAEALPDELARTLLDRAGSLTNLYGPTETTVWSTARHLVPADAASGRTLSSIGGPIGNTQVRPRRAPGARAARRGRRAVHRRRRPGARLPRPARADGGPVRGLPVRRARPAHVPHRRRGALEHGR
ncbi:hypothetical protein GCM10023237_14280 [Streptomyces coeruleoprunus]